MIKLRHSLGLDTFYEAQDGEHVGYIALTPSELEQRERAAFEAGRNGTSYNDDISGQIVDLWKYDTADDYLKQRNREQALSDLVADGEKNGDYDDQAS